MGGAGRGRAGGVLRRAAAPLLLPADLVYDLPRLTAVAGLSLTVENHRGLLAFAPDQVTIAAGAGRIVVKGSELRVGVVRGEEITVTGQLQAIVFEREVEPSPPPRR
ncbi:MAG TPA: YabP/YqfC family sporulation protein [Bacillota bacterium]|nr:YabP/YqfC family sporulation protein [Bacillota bacterium]